MKWNRKVVGYILSCIVYLASIVVSPDLNAFWGNPKGTPTISKTDSWKDAGVTKNEVKSFSFQSIACSGLVYIHQIWNENATILPNILAYYSKSNYFEILSLVNLGVRVLIFPHHTFW